MDLGLIAGKSVRFDMDLKRLAAVPVYFHLCKGFTMIALGTHIFSYSYEYNTYHYCLITGEEGKNEIQHCSRPG